MKKIIVIIIVLLILSSCLFFVSKSGSVYTTKLDEVKLIEKSEEMNNLFAVNVEQTDGTYKEQNGFPGEGYIFDNEKSECIDSEGQIIDGILSYKDNKVIIDVISETYCYIYFNLIDTLTELCNKYDNIGNCITNEQDNISYIPNLSDDLQGGMHRYQGRAEAVNNNYVCFGYGNKEIDCDFSNLANTDKYAYRIIGINSEGQLKLIKKEALNTAYYWHSTEQEDITWPNSDLYKGLNGINGGTYQNLFVNNIEFSYMATTSEWYLKIENYVWKYGYNTNVNISADDLYNIEELWDNTISAKIGLIYSHDYAYQSGTRNCSRTGDYLECKKGWMFITNNDSLVSSEYEWTMSYFQYHYGYFTAWNIIQDGFISDIYINNNHLVRPVFYLTTDISIKEGTGTISNPYIIS